GPGGGDCYGGFLFCRAEGGIRDSRVTGVQTCALPISDSAGLLVTHGAALAEYVRDNLPAAITALPEPQRGYCAQNMKTLGGIIRSEERRVGKEGGAGWGPAPGAKDAESAPVRGEPTSQ